VDHPTGGHDDHANSLALAVALASHTRGDPVPFWCRGHGASSGAPG
jgi:hypothetical protein